MTNREIASQFNILAKLMELHDENVFKVRSYQKAHAKLKRYPTPLSTIPFEDLSQIEGVGKAISGKITELLKDGEMDLLNRMKAKTPTGVIELLTIPGLTPKMGRKLWKNLEIESPLALLHACKNDELVKLKGFGPKSQVDIKEKIEFFLAHKGKHIYAQVRHLSIEIINIVNSTSIVDINIVGQMARKNQVIDHFDFLHVLSIDLLKNLNHPDFSDWVRDDKKMSCTYKNSYSVRFFETKILDASVFHAYTATAEVWNEIKHLSSDQLSELNIPNECLDDKSLLGLNYDELIAGDDIKGVIHTHSTYSDGANTIEEMAMAAEQKGYEYIAISDHSKSAVYANGLSIEHVLMQHREIDELNASGKFIPILKSIESDILGDGRLDYPEDILASFDLVIASVHSNLKMEKAVATKRILKAVKNPFTNILGHMTGRLLLTRPGYLVDYDQIFEACAKNNVSIEINANPLRLDLDKTQVMRATKRGVKICINPDAHNIHGIDDIEFGVIAARKGGLIKKNCLNTLDVHNFLSCFRN